ncbi:helix-turn-helix domain-containing protein [Bacillus mycoides]|uniref:helix-turn-helix domain-containing protein n=1 Tax=Bacillus mycoides TaxID=1405 RepID=UPI00211248F6|nr:helix-turn-helix transcriptional regulator [Bacillus mycoides]MCQ6527888.1 helix-turn-helix transcriptional regulator [Bacillus mycoides]
MQIKSEKTELQKSFEESGLKYKELASIVGISTSYCHKIINQNLRVYYDVAHKIAKALGKEPSLLFKEQEKIFEH